MGPFGGLAIEYLIGFGEPKVILMDLDLKAYSQVVCAPIIKYAGIIILPCICLTYAWERRHCRGSLALVHSFVIMMHFTLI
jgi:hypothetical protein